MKLFFKFQDWWKSILPEKTWLWQGILFPFFVTRLCLVLTAFFTAGNFPGNPTYEKYLDRGFFLTRVFILDIFTRWDSAAYFSIVTGGYSPSSDIRTVYSNIPFFPLYPYLVKSIGWLGISLPGGFYIAFGLLLSNLFLLVGLILLYQLITQDLKFSNLSAEKTIGLLFVFPTAFIFSSFYTESLFFFLSILSFYLAYRNKWGWAALTAGFILVTRTQGLVVWGILFVFYLERKGWSLRNLKIDFAWLVISPIGLLAHLYHLKLLTGEPLAPFTAMTAWGRGNSNILVNLWENISAPFLDVFKFDLVFSLLFIAASIFILIKWPMKSIGLLSLALSITPIASGLLVSASRYLLIVFPVFIYFGKRLEKSAFYEPLRAFLFTLQIIYFSGWVNYFWID